ncbi:MAG: hypothetical protein JNK37_19720 [Verrucomicrobiales bacterium]|nr:hypothetical protein [Verrucomicrobiales bacterium]
MSRAIKWSLGLGVVAYVVVVGVVVARAYLRMPDLVSSPTETRVTQAYRDDQLGVFEPADRDSFEGYPAGAEMRVPVRVPSDGDGVLYDWMGEPEVKQQAMPSRWAEGLEGDGAVEFFAYSLWYPSGDSPAEVAMSDFREIGSQRLLERSELDALGVPEAFHRLQVPTRYRAPVMRLLCRVRGMPVARLCRPLLGDARTGAAISYDLEELEEGYPAFAQAGEWCRLDTALLCWHDTPVKVSVQALTGDPERATLQREIGASVVFPDRLRVQWLDQADEEMEVEHSVNRFTPMEGWGGAGRQDLIDRLRDPSDPDRRVAWIKPSGGTPGSTRSLMVRVSSGEYLREHCGWRLSGENGYRWNWDYLGEADQMTIVAAEIEAGLDAGTPIELVFLPRRTELTCEIGGLPDAPNGREIANLFDLKIPHLILPEDPEDAEDLLLAMIAVATQYAWDFENLWEDHLPASMPADRTFRGATPRELLEFYLKSTPGSRLEIDEAEKLMKLNENREPWFTRLVEWVEGMF